MFFSEWNDTVIAAVLCESWTDTRSRKTPGRKQKTKKEFLEEIIFWREVGGGTNNYILDQFYFIFYLDVHCL